MIAVLRKEIVLNKTATRAIGVGLFVVLTTLGAFVRIPLPFTPVPITLQTFFVLLSGAFLGAKFGFSSQLLYVSLGLLGLPIFSNAGGGILYLFGPTAGYLIGFILASLFIGRCISHIKNNLFSVFVLFILGDFILLFLGATWLKFLTGYSMNKALLLGFVPFVPGDLLKAFVASTLYVRLKPRLKEIFF